MGPMNEFLMGTLADGGKTILLQIPVWGTVQISRRGQNWTLSSSWKIMF